MSIVTVVDCRGFRFERFLLTSWVRWVVEAVIWLGMPSPLEGNRGERLMMANSTRWVMGEGEEVEPPSRVGEATEGYLLIVEVEGVAYSVWSNGGYCWACEWWDETRAGVLLKLFGDCVMVQFVLDVPRDKGWGKEVWAVVVGTFEGSKSYWEPRGGTDK